MCRRPAHASARRESRRSSSRSKARKESSIIAFDEISDLVLAGPVSLSTPPFRSSSRRDTPVAWMSSGFWFLGSDRRARPEERRRADGAICARRRSLRAVWLSAAPSWRPRSAISARSCVGTGAARKARATGALQALETLGRPHRARPYNVASLLGLEGEAAAIYFRNLPQLFQHRGCRALPAFSFERQLPPAAL